MIDDRELSQQLRDAANGISPRPGAVDRALLDAKAHLRRRHTVVAGTAVAVIAAAVITPIALRGGGGADASLVRPGFSPPTRATGPSNVATSEATASGQRGGPYLPSGPPPGHVPPPNSVVTAQGTAQSAFVHFLASLGGQLDAAPQQPDLSAREFSVGGDVSLDNQQGTIYVRVYKDTSDVGTDSPCAALQNSQGNKVSTCRKTTEPNGSTTWAYTLTSTGNAELTLNSLNLRADGQAVFAQATNYPGIVEPAASASGTAVLSAAQLDNLAILPALAFPAR